MNSLPPNIYAQRVLTAVAQLLATLEAIAEVHAKHGTPTEATTRQAVFQSLGVVIEFIRNLDRSRDLGFALRRLLVTLADIEAGHSINWLSNTTGHRPAGLRIETASVRGRYAACVELLMCRHKEPLNRAADVVARAIPKDSSALEGVRGTVPEAVKSWRDQCTNFSNNSPMKYAFDGHLALASLNPSISVALMLDALRGLPRAVAKTTKNPK
jgi:hypothetical protein